MTTKTFGESSPTTLATVRIAKTVRGLMASNDVVQMDLLNVLGLSQTGISKRLRGITPFDVNELDVLARFFNMTLAELVAEAERPRPAGPETAAVIARRNGATRGYPYLNRVTQLFGAQAQMDAQSGLLFAPNHAEPLPAAA